MYAIRSYYDSTVLKTAYNKAIELQKAGEVKILPIGKKAVEFFEKRNFNIIASYQQVAETVDIYDSMDIAEEIIEQYNVITSYSIHYTKLYELSRDIIKWRNEFIRL